MSAECETCKTEIANVKERLSQMESSMSEKSMNMWKEINKLRDNYGSHDATIQLLAQSIDHMSKELSKSVGSLANTLSKHLNEEEKGMRETISELRKMGWKIFYALVLAGLSGASLFKFVG